jgi:uncharacterized protein (TIGR02147 family)
MYSIGIHILSNHVVFFHHCWYIIAMTPQRSIHLKKPDIFTYFNYRTYFRDLFQFKKNQSPVFSNRYIVKKAGFQSPSTLNNIIKGKRNISGDAALRFATAFQLNGFEQRYFLELVAFNQAAEIAEQEKHLDALTGLRANSTSAGKLESGQEEYLAHWWHPVIREALLLPDAKKSSIWLARVLSPAIAPAEAKASVKLLKRIGLVTKMKGTWQQKEKILATDPQLQSVKAAQFHRQMIRLGMESTSRVKQEDREISGTTIRIAKKDFPRCVELIREFRKKLLCLASTSENADQVYQFNSQLFPVVSINRPRRIK